MNSSSYYEREHGASRNTRAGLVVNAIVLWNTRYIDAALDELRRTGHTVDDADV